MRRLPLVPKGGSRPPKATSIEVVDSVGENEKYQSALPVFDLAVAAGAFGPSQAPEPTGWARVQSSRPIDRRMFLARVVGQSMEDGISNGSWCVFRMYPDGYRALGNGPRRQASHRAATRGEPTPRLGGQYTLKRWRVAQLAADGSVVQIELRPDNPSFKAMKYSAKDGELRAVAEFIEVVGLSWRQNVFTCFVFEDTMSLVGIRPFAREVKLFRQHGGRLRLSEALRLGINRKRFYAMRDAGVIVLVTRGLYRLAALDPLAHPDLVVVATRVSHGVVCLISALSYHELTTQVPHTIDVALERGTRKPLLDYPPAHFYWFSGAAFRDGIETHELDGVPVRIYDPEKSLVDCFRYRNQIGMDVVLEAMRLWRERRRKKLNVLLTYARMRHVERAMRPYLEAMS